MRHSVKAFVSLVLCLILCLSLSVCASAEGETISNVNEAYALVRDTELISIYEATLNMPGKDAQSIYYVVCKGLDFSEFDPDEPRSYTSAIKIGLSDEDNAYTRELISVVKNYIPEGKTVVFVGHSMGGMVLQQVIANSEIKKLYDIPYSLSIGSPYILTSRQKEGTLRRVVDKLDPVPFMSIPMLANPYMGNVSIESTHLFPLIHFQSYEKGTVWKMYDALGRKNGGATIVLNKLIYQ